MSFDISTGDASVESAPEANTFASFYERHVDELARAVAMTCGDLQVAQRSLDHGLARTAQLWRLPATRSHPAALTFATAVDHAAGLVDDRAATYNKATGGYLRGLDMSAAFADLPLPQRAALVASVYLQWSDDEIASGYGVQTDTIMTRRTRALAHLGHHLDLPPAEVEGAASAYLRTLADQPVNPAASIAAIRRRGSRRSWRNRLLAGAAACTVIVGGATALVAAPEATIEVAGPEAVDPPTTSAAWLPPVSDGQGGFIAANIAGATRFSSSADGVDWFAEAVWNSKRIDIRSDVTSFVRSGNQYVATVEVPQALSGSVAPHVATSTDLKTWTVHEVAFDLPADVNGVRHSVSIASVAATSTHILVAVQVEESLDYRAFGITESAVCVHVPKPRVLRLHLCDGEVIDVELPVARSDAGSETRYLVSESGGPFTEIVLPTPASGPAIVSLGDRFAVVDGITGRVFSSQTGQEWTPSFTPASESRFVLLAGAPTSEALLITPEVTGWSSSLLSDGAVALPGSLPITVDPASVWMKPEVAHGPAGWAVFVTTSRPWERTNASQGWAVAKGEWVVSRQPDAEVIQAFSLDGGTFRFRADDATHVRQSSDGLTLFDPETGDVLVQISDDDIERSLGDSVRDAGDIKAEVFFSADGVTWRSIWQSTRDTRFATVAVGDDEVLLSGAELTGAPIVIDLG